MITRLLLAALLLPLPAGAAPWALGEPVTLSDGSRAGFFHHLDGAGRRHVAATAERIAIVWEDDRSGDPQTYIALGPHGGAAFTEYRLSDGREAYEPVVVALDATRFVAAWEQDGALYARNVSTAGPGPALRLAPGTARQVSLASDGSGRLAAVWAAVEGGGQLLHAAELTTDGERLRRGAAVPVVRPGAHPFHGYPSACFTADGALVVAWEDRRAGHSRLFVARRDPDGRFAPELQLNEHNAPVGPAGEALSLGSGVMRVALAADGGRLHAVWLDKRNPNAGYAVWGAASSDGGRRFAANERVQDELGSAVPQWHAALAGGAGRFVAAWDDSREGWGDAAESGDVLLSWREQGGWSDDLLVPHASGAGYQGSPALALDPRGDLHLVWLERADLAAPTRLRYLHGRRADR